MHIRTLFWLLVGVLFTGAFYLFVTVRDHTERNVPAEGALVLDADPETVDQLAIETAGWHVECRKVHGRWRMLTPMQGAADVGVVEHILGELALLPREEVATPAQMKMRGLTLASYGLDKPAASITVRSGASAPVTLQLGAPGPFPSSIFVKRVDEPVVITTRTNILAAFPAEVGAFRDRRLLDGDASSVVRVEVESRSSAFVQLALEKGEWRLLQPFADRADSPRIQSLLRDLMAAEVRNVVSDEHIDPAAYGLGRDSAEVVLTLWLAGEEAPTRIEFGRSSGPGGDRLCARLGGTGPVFAVDTNLLNLLTFRAQDLRDRVRVRFQPETIRGFSIEAGERRISASTRGDLSWQLTEPFQAPGDAERIRSFLMQAPSLTAVGFDEASAPAQPPMAQARFWTGASNGPASSECRLRLLDAAEGDRYRADTGTGVVFFLDGPAVRQVFGPEPFWDLLRFRDRAMLSLSADAVKRVTLIRGEVEQAAERDEKGHWLAHDGRQVNPEVLEGLLRAVAALRALRLEQPGPEEKAYGFEMPVARLELGLDGGEGIQKTVILGGSDPAGNRYARVQGQDLVFVLPVETADALMRDLLQ